MMIAMEMRRQKEKRWRGKKRGWRGRGFARNGEEEADREKKKRGAA
jgi:hypothetical protein